MVDLKSAKQFKLSALEKLGIPQFGADLPENLIRQNILDAQFFLNPASQDYLYIATGEINSFERKTAYNQYDRCEDLSRRLREYLFSRKI